jgi:acylphosphatase
LNLNAVTYMERVAQTRLRITGKVQGVFYRKSAQKRAQELGLSGYVQNENDGSVTALVQGGEEAIEAFYRWCQSGPPGAKVADVERRTEEGEALEGFNIRA